MFTIDDVALTRAVNGVPVDLTDAERQAVADEWNVNETKIQTERDAQEAERLRKQNLRGDALAVELLDKLRAATPAQISSYVDAQVTDLASARVMLKRIVLVLALVANGG